MTDYPKEHKMNVKVPATYRTPAATVELVVDEFSDVLGKKVVWDGRDIGRVRQAKDGRSRGWWSAIQRSSRTYGPINRTRQSAISELMAFAPAPVPSEHDLNEAWGV